MDNLYQENIIDHYQHPRNFGKLPKPTVSHEELNSFCGDRIRMDLEISDDKIVDVKFVGNGCAISVAAASLLTQKIQSLKVSEVQKFKSNEVEKLLQIPLTPTRLKCALLPWEVLQKALQKYQNK